MDPVTQTFLKESNAIEGVFDKRSLSEANAAWEYLLKQEKMTMSVVLMTHKILMQSQNIEAHYRGHFRQQQVYIGNRPALHHSKIRNYMETWVEQMNRKYKKLPWKELHVEYERIHPFIDGNGRTGRMFMNWFRLKNGERIYVVKASDRFKYYDWFRQ